jgi:hypothetical protein
LESGRKSEELRKTLLDLSADDSYQVREAVFASMAGLWQLDEPLCWAAVRLAQALAVTKHSGREDSAHTDLLELLHLRKKAARNAARRQKYTIQVHLAAFVSKRRPRVAEIPQRGRVAFDPWEFAPALRALPPKSDQSDARVKTLALIDRLLAWTISESLSREDGGEAERRVAEWADRLLLWTAQIAPQFAYDEFHLHVLAPVMNAWPKAPHLTKALLDGFVRTHFQTEAVPSEVVQASWKAISDWVLDSRLLRTNTFRFERLGRDVNGSVEMIVFGSAWGPEPLPSWPHAEIFADVIGKWVHTVGHFPSTYSYMIEFLRRWGFVFAPEPLLEWIDHSLTQATDLEQLLDEHSNSDRTARLLRRVLDERTAGIRDAQGSTRRMSSIVDRVAAYGNPLARSIQIELESLL